MKKKVLVAYATKYGGTTEIAERIGQGLRDAGMHVDIFPVERVTDLELYAAVVLGSAVYMGQWRKPAVSFLESNEKLLAGRPVWFFSSGPTGEGDPIQLMNGWRFPEAQKPIADRIQPRDIANFHGILDAEKLSFTERLLLRGIKAPMGDFRDWDAIESWAAAIADILKGDAS